jgi:hypothetical protein
MLRSIALTLALLLGAALSAPNPALAGRCSGGAGCTACSTCSSCGHCAGGGGTCSVCAPPRVKKVTPAKRKTHKRAPKKQHKHHGQAAPKH